MVEQMIMGNQAIALGALKAGVNLVAGYPGTPSSEIIEFISKYRKQTGTYVEWSINEKAAAEVAAAASYAGSRTMVTMKQVGLNVASDPVMCLSYVGVKGGMVIVVADDPGPISSQTEQDTRTYGEFSKLPVLDPSTPKEAFEMVQDAFELSEKYGTPVILRPTTRVDHAYESMEFPELSPCRKNGEFEKDSARWVIFPRSSFLNHKRIFERNEKILPKVFSECRWNFINEGGSLPLASAKVVSTGSTTMSCATPSAGSDAARNACSFAAGGISYQYLMEALSILGMDDVSVLKIGTPYPFPEDLAVSFLKAHSEVTVFEELDPVIEKQLLYIAGKNGLEIKVHGKLDGTVPEAGELSVEIIQNILSGTDIKTAVSDIPELPVRPPVLCAGCPHRASFYAVKQAMKNEKTVYCGDIGCYTLGNAKPLDMCDTCLCMGADITMAQGFYHNEPDRHCFSFIGDSTFFASGITGVINAVYNQAKMTVCVLDNSTTAMTGHQPHPGTGVTMMGQIVDKVSIQKVLESVGVSPVIVVDPFDQKASVEAVKECDKAEGVSAVIFKAPCIAICSKLGLPKPVSKVVNTEKCIGCQKCIKELGCPALSIISGEKKVTIDKSLCTGCGLCGGVCPLGAIN